MRRRLRKRPALLDVCCVASAACTVSCNDEDMLMEGPYPYPLKQRIKGNHGHLSNRQAQALP